MKPIIFYLEHVHLFSAHIITMRTHYSFCSPLCSLIICCQWRSCHKSAKELSGLCQSPEESTCFCFLTKPISTFCFSLVDIAALVFLHSPSPIFCVTYLPFRTCFPLPSANEQKQSANLSLQKKASDKVCSHYCLNPHKQLVYGLYF